MSYRAAYTADLRSQLSAKEAECARLREELKLEGDSAARGWQQVVDLEALLAEAGKALEPFAREADKYNAYSAADCEAWEMPSGLEDMRAARSLSAKIAAALAGERT